MRIIKVMMYFSYEFYPKRNLVQSPTEDLVLYGFKVIAEESRQTKGSNCLVYSDNKYPRPYSQMCFIVHMLNVTQDFKQRTNARFSTNKGE